MAVTVIQDGQNFALEILDKVKEKMKRVKKGWDKESVHYDEKRRAMYYETIYLRAIIKVCQLREYALQLKMMQNKRQTKADREKK